MTILDPTGYLIPMITRSQNGGRWLRCLALVLLSAAGAVALSQGGASESPALHVVASLNPWADVISQIGGARVEVATLLPAGASPHAFEPLPSQVADLARSDLVVMNGGLDSWLDRMLEAAAPDVPHVRLMEAIDFKPLQGVGHGDEESHAMQEEIEDSAGPMAANPHIWLDPSIVMAAVPLLAGELARLDPDGAEVYEGNAASLLKELTALDESIYELLDGLGVEAFVPFHDAWPYFARRYRLTILATLEPFAGREPSARYVAETVSSIRSVGASVIFAERQLNDRTALVVAESAGVDVVTLDPIGGPPGPSRYQDLLLHNARAIAGALRR